MADDFLFDDSFEPSTEWARAIDIQLDLIRWYESDEGRKYAKHFGESYHAKIIQGLQDELGDATAMLDPESQRTIVTYPEGVSPERLAQLVEENYGVIDAYAHLGELEHRRLANADTYYVTEEIAERIGELARTLPKDLDVTEAMVPSQFGFVYIPSALMCIDARSEMYATKGICWGVGEDGFNRTIYTDPSDPRETDVTAQRTQAGGPTLRCPLVLFDAQGTPWGQMLDRRSNRPVALDDFDYDDAVVEAAAQDSMFQWRWLVAFWLFCQEEITILARPKRGAARRAERVLNLAPSELSVRVVRLRKAKYVHPDGSVVAPRVIDWSHRWRVRGHKRVLYRGTGDEKVVWVSEYVKGPKHAPLIERDDVMVVHR